MTIRKPMLAVAGDDHEALEYPRLASPKLDGIRALTHQYHGLCSRTFKPIRNLHIRRALDYAACEGLDGELITYNADGTMRTFSEVSGDVMRSTGEPRFIFHVFDDFSDPDLPFEQRYLHLFDRISTGMPHVQYVPHAIVNNPEELVALRDKYMSKGYEGLMTRTLAGKYKQGRSTEKQGWLLKHKVWRHRECVVTGFEEGMHNNNPKECTGCGGSKRGQSKAGMVPAGTLGKFLARDTVYGDIKVTTGVLTAPGKQAIWDNPNDTLGRVLKYKFQLEGAKDKPRFAGFVGWRHEDDM